MAVRISGTIQQRKVAKVTQMYPTHDASTGRGGYREIETDASLADIPDAFLDDGMLVYVRNKDSDYRYDSSNNIWNPVHILTDSEYTTVINASQLYMSSIEDSQRKVLPTISLSGGGIYETGSSVSPSLTWSFGNVSNFYNGSKTDGLIALKLVCSDKSADIDVSANSSWTSSTLLTDTTTYTLSMTCKNVYGYTVTTNAATVKYDFRYEYFLYTSDTEYTSANVSGVSSNRGITAFENQTVTKSALSIGDGKAYLYIMIPEGDTCSVLSSIGNIELFESGFTLIGTVVHSLSNTTTKNYSVYKCISTSTDAVWSFTVSKN